MKPTYGFYIGLKHAVNRHKRGEVFTYRGHKFLWYYAVYLVEYLSHVYDDKTYTGVKAKA